SIIDDEVELGLKVLPERLERGQVGLIDEKGLYPALFEKDAAVDVGAVDQGAWQEIPKGTERCARSSRLAHVGNHIDVIRAEPDFENGRDRFGVLQDWPIEALVVVPSR